MVDTKIAPVDTQTFEIHNQSDWTFYHSVYPMANTKELDKLQDLAECDLPEVFYSKNTFMAALPLKNLLVEINPVQSISHSSFAKREKTLRKDDGQPREFSPSDDITALNPIEVVPKGVLVPQNEVWKKKDTSKIEDFVVVEALSDWTFSTPYKGQISFISKEAERIKKFTDLDLQHHTESTTITSEMSDESIPYNKLGPDNPIRHFATLYLFECDLEDCGYTMSQIRFRVMEDSWFVLLRYYLRVDGVTVRLLDTRLYH